MLKNSTLIEKTVEITVARMSNATASTNESSGKNVADFMQEIYNKLVELSKNEEE